MRKGRDGGNGKKKEKKRKRRMKIVATTSLPAVDRPNADHWNAARSRQLTIRGLFGPISSQASGFIVEVGVLIVVGVEVEVGVQLLFWVVSGWCMDGWIKRNRC